MHAVVETAKTRNANFAQRILISCRIWTRALTRAPRHLNAASFPVGRTITASAVFVVCLALTWWFLDASVNAQARELPKRVIHIFNVITDFGKSAWVITPLGLLLAGLAALPRLPRSANLVFASLTARIGFLFTAVCLSELFTSIVKRIIGRTRPYATAGDPFAFHPWSFEPQHNGFPSGHSTTAFALAAGISMVWPRSGIAAAAWIYAVLIGISRVIVNSHFPTDVLASAAIGISAALLVRRYFAMRGLVFTMEPGGLVLPFSGPSRWRLKRAAATLFQRAKGQSK